MKELSEDGLNVRGQAVREANKLVREGIKDVLEAHDFQNSLRRMMREEIMKQLGARTDADLKNILLDEARKMAAEYVERNLAIKFVGGEW
ncbi:hypothetical protein [Cupriavidus campinensis]|uniref:Uncharacterized protein n=1 Tax=Cupriavidus campinensis TaxID=151783 RepID=A0ABY3ETA3_9BURK|nr:hypothetical protein [Cupriavidus campinensis]TSP14006.1 hypothetical protein FGG12_05915 [Cupriavidus campinensis]